MWLFQQMRKAKRYYKTIIASDDDKSVGGKQGRIPVMAKIRYNLLGFTDKEIRYYDLLHNDYHQYISNWERLKLEDVNGRFADILGEKVMLERIWGNYIGVPKTYCLIERGKFLDLSDEKEEADIISILHKKGKLLTKPTRSGGGGHGVESLEYIDGKYYIGKRELTEDDFLSELRSYYDYMVSDWVYPHEYAKKVFPETTNTMRIVTIMNHTTNKAEIMMAVHRFGTKLSIPVDNACSGGICSFVDIETGKLGAAHDMIHEGMRFKNHPETNERIEGLQIPDWENIKKKMTHVHNCFPYFEFLAWDVVINEEGEVYILEINRGMDVHWLQVDKPLRNETLGKYMRSKGMLSKW